MVSDFFPLEYLDVLQCWGVTILGKVSPLLCRPPQHSNNHNVNIFMKIFETSYKAKEGVFLL